MSVALIGVILVASAAAFLVGWLLSRSKYEAARHSVDTELRISEERKYEVLAELAQVKSSLESERGAHGVSREQLAAAVAQQIATQGEMDRRVQELQQIESRLKISFQALAGEALNANTKHLIDLSKAELGKQQTEASRNLGEKENSITSLLGPIRETLAQLTERTQELEVKREGAYQQVLAEMRNVQETHSSLRKETTQLVQALRAPKARGNWGEMILKRCVEYAGMLEYASFEVEKFMRGDDSASIRPDLIVRLPNNRSIVIDAKTPLDAFLNAGACEDEIQRVVHLKQHVAAVRGHLDALASKSYWKRFPDSPEFVICFLPGEALFSAALEQDPTLLGYSAESNVLLATPTTLIALLKAVAYGWQQDQTARDATRIRDLATNVHAKLVNMHSDLVSLGKALRTAGDAYDDAMTKAEGRGGLFSIGKQLRELNIGDKDFKESRPAAVRPRLPQSEAWSEGFSLAAEAASESAEPVDVDLRQSSPAV
jgi:DNA recombination protein RmuC